MSARNNNTRNLPLWSRLAWLDFWILTPIQPSPDAGNNFRLLPQLHLFQGLFITLETWPFAISSHVHKQRQQQPPQSPISTLFKSGFYPSHVLSPLRSDVLGWILSGGDMNRGAPKAGAHQLPRMPSRAPELRSLFGHQGTTLTCLALNHRDVRF